METSQEPLVTQKKSKPSVWRSMSLFLVPLLLSNVLQSVGQLVGMMAVGRWLGVDAVAAVSSFFPLFFLLISFTIGIGSGSSILIGQASLCNTMYIMLHKRRRTLTFNVFQL